MRDGCSNVLGWANAESQNTQLIKSVLCAALYPNVVKVRVAILSYPSALPFKSPAHCFLGLIS